jgi:hypothetical protein
MSRVFTFYAWQIPDVLDANIHSFSGLSAMILTSSLIRYHDPPINNNIREHYAFASMHLRLHSKFNLSCRIKIKPLFIPGRYD